MDSSVPPRSPHSRQSLIVGREREQAILREALDAMLGGHGSLVLVSGEAGIGKTTLVEWLAREAEAEGCIVLRGGCYDLTTTPPYGPWRELRRSYASLGTDPLMPSFDSEPTAADALASQHALVDLTWDALSAIARQQPLVLVLEDLHWSDTASPDLLRIVARRMSDEHILLVATYRRADLTRHQPLYQILPTLLRESSPRRIEVQPLSPQATSALIAIRYALKPADHARLIAWLSHRAEGNPFFLQEFLHALEHQQLHQEHGGGWTLDDLQTVRVPTMLRQVIDARLARLGDRAIELLKVGAVVGHQVPLDLWATVSGASGDDLTETIEQASAASIVIELPHGSGWQFRHALIREALYEEIVSVRRRDWHRRVAESLAAGSHPDPDVVAHHFQQASDDRAVDWLIRAGERAALLYASKTVIERLETALPALEELGDDRRRGWILWLLGEQFGFIDTVRSIAYLDEAERLGSTIDDKLLVAYARMYRGLNVNRSQTLSAGVPDVTSGVDLLDELIGHPLEPPPIHVPNWSNPIAYHAFRALMRAIAGDLTAALEDIPEYASGVADQEFERRLKTDMKMVSGAIQPERAYNALGRVRATQGRTTEASRAFELSTSLMERTNDDAQHAIGYMNWLAYLVLPYFADDLELRRTLLERHDRAWQRAAEKFGAGPMPAGVSHLLTSYLDGCWSEMDWMKDWWHEHMAPSAVPWQVKEQSLLGRRAHARGEYKRAWHEIRSYLPEGAATEPGDCVFRVAEELQRLAIELALDEGRLSEARDWLEAHDRWLEWSGAVLGRAEGALLWACYQLVDGDPGGARRLAEAALRHASDPRQPVALIAIHRFLGKLGTKSGHFGDADQHFMESLRLADACVAPFERALTLLEIAELRLAQNQTNEASALLDEVQAICEPLGARPTLARATALRDQISQPPKKDVRYPAGLSPREVEVLRFVAAGLTDAEIAGKLFVSRRTINSHLTNIYNKIGLGSRAAVSVWAKEQSLL
jgi:DNA-binding CsgD family transcriptional regulator